MTVYNTPRVGFAGISMVTATLGVNDPEVGTVMRNGDEEYLFVYNAGNSQISPGLGCVVSGVSGYSVTVSSVTHVDFLVGVARHATLTTATYGWVVTKGFIQVQMGANNSCAVAEQLQLGTDGNFGRRGSCVTDTVYGPCVGKAMAAIASGASGTAYIKAFY